MNKDLILTIKANAQQALQSLQQAKDSVKSFSNSVNSNIKSVASNASSSFDSVANSIATMSHTAAGLFLGGSFGMGVLVKSASELQSMRASFESMTGSAENAAKVMGSLNKFSFDTAFSTSDINTAARTLLGAGLNVDDLGERMQQLGDIAGATGADLGRLTLPISQAMARGKLQTEDFYQILDSGAGMLGLKLREELAERGMGDIMEAMADGELSAEILFKVMEDAIKEGGFAFQGALKQSKTFEGQMSNLKETVENVGLELLGVNKATGEIDPSGVFAHLSSTVQSATEWLNTNKETIKAVGVLVIDNAVPAVSALASAFIAATIAGAIFRLTALSPIELLFVAISIAVTALIGAFTFLQVKFDIFGKSWTWIKNTSSSALNFIDQKINDITNLTKDLADALKSNVIDTLSTLKSKALEVSSAIKKWLGDNKEWITNIAIVIGTLLIPKLLQLIVKSAMSFKTLAKNATLAARKTATQGLIAFKSWLKQLPKVAMSSIKNFKVASKRALMNAKTTAAAGIKATNTWIKGFLRTSATAIKSFAIMSKNAVIHALRIGKSWLMAMGPLGIVVAVVIGVVALIVANWETVQKAFSAVWNWIVANWSTLLAVLTGPISATVSMIVSNWEIVKRAFKNAWNFITSLWSGFTGFFGGVFRSVVRIFRNIGSTVASTIANTVKGAINSVIGTAENTINGFINNINGIIGIINKIPNVSIPNVSTISIPRLATGGIVPAVDGGRTITVAEGGQAEWVVPESKMASLISQVANKANKNNTNQQNVTVNINIESGGEIDNNKAVEIAKSITRALRSQGLKIDEMSALR